MLRMCWVGCGRGKGIVMNHSIGVVVFVLSVLLVLVGVRGKRERGDQYRVCKGAVGAGSPST